MTSRTYIPQESKVLSQASLVFSVYLLAFCLGLPVFHFPRRKSAGKQKTQRERLEDFKGKSEIQIKKTIS
jgi:hypothetical protein